MARGRLTPERRRKLREEKNRYYRATQDAENSRKRWDGADDERVLTHEIPDRQLSEEIGRSMKAIERRRSALKAATRMACTNDDGD